MQGYDKFFKQARKAASNEGPTRISAQVNTAKKTRPAAQTQAASPEAQIKKMMQERLRSKKQQKAKTKAPFPKGAFAIVVVGLVVCAAGLAFPQSYEWITSHVEIGFLTEASASDAKENKDDKAAKAAADKSAKAAGEDKTAEAKAAAPDSTQASHDMPDTRQWTEEETSFFNKLSERKRELDLKESELVKLEEELQKQRVELDEKIKQLETMRGQIAQTLKSRVDNDQEKVTKLVEVYSGMKPTQAAKVIETINEDLAVQILDRMKKKSASDILNVMNAQKAQRLSEMLAGYKRVE